MHRRRTLLIASLIACRSLYASSAHVTPFEWGSVSTRCSCVNCSAPHRRQLRPRRHRAAQVIASLMTSLMTSRAGDCLSDDVSHDEPRR